MDNYTEKYNKALNNDCMYLHFLKSYKKYGNFYECFKLFITGRWRGLCTGDVISSALERAFYKVKGHDYYVYVKYELINEYNNKKEYKVTFISESHKKWAKEAKAYDLIMKAKDITNYQEKKGCRRKYSLGQLSLEDQSLVCGLASDSDQF